MTAAYGNLTYWKKVRHRYWHPVWLLMEIVDGRAEVGAKRACNCGLGGLLTLMAGPGEAIELDDVCPSGRNAGADAKKGW